MLEDNKDVIKADLELISDLLVRNGICEDPSPIQKAIGHSYKHSKDESWEYKIVNLKFILDTFSHVIPQGADLLELYLSMDLKGLYTSNKALNPLLDMQLNIVIQGLNKEGDDLLASWHFDKHDPDDDDEESKFLHPEYHFTYGGRKMWGYTTTLNWGASLILPTPRFHYPPLDGILGIDFVLSNYIKKDRRNKITKLPEYKKMIRRSQERIWKPYYLSISNYWTKHLQEGDVMDLSKLIPNLIY